jgi:hypothetical protein
MREWYFQFLERSEISPLRTLYMKEIRNENQRTQSAAGYLRPPYLYQGAAIRSRQAAAVQGVERDR